MEYDNEKNIFIKNNKKFKETIGTECSFETRSINIINFFYKDSSSFYQKKSNKRSRIGSKLFLLEENANVEYEEDLENISDSYDIRGLGELISKNQLKKKMKYASYSSDEGKIKYNKKEERIFDIKMNLILRENLSKKSKKSTNFNKNQEEILYSINIQINNDLLIEDLIKTSIEKFNEKLKSEKSNFLLSLNYENYKIKPAKKSGKANQDLPCN